MGHKTAVCHLWPGLVMGVFCLPACIEPNSGSNVQFDFGEGVQTATVAGVPSEEEQPPEDTYYALWAADYVYRDVNPADGRPDLDMNNEPLVDQAFLFEVQRFEIRSAIDRSSPCFIDLEGTRFPGIHVTQFATAVRAATGITDPFLPGQDPDDVSDVLTADRRASNLPLIESALKSVASYADFRYPAIGTQCANEAGVDRMLIPPATCADPESNTLRLERCRLAWAANPEFYEGSDKVFTLPLNGRFFGMVEGMNPINNGFVGGSGFFVEPNLVDLEAYVLNWQYDDLDHDGAPDVPIGSPSSPTGFPYMQGKPVQVTRGTFTVSLRHATNPRITATMAIFPNLGSDDVHF